MAAGPLTQKQRRQTASQKIIIIWPIVFFLLVIHCTGLYGLYNLVTRGQWYNWLYVALLNETALLGIGVGAHRLWSHKSYQAKLPLRIFLAFCQTAAFQLSIHSWARDHRLHHQYSETDADPHNASRGFFFAHIGWLMVRKSDSVLSKGNSLDMSDLEADPVVMFQKKYYQYLVLWIAFVLPAVVPWYFWNENFIEAWFYAVGLKHLLSINLLGLVNSAAHFWGSKPYNKSIYPSENKFVNYATCGEGFHNYHHTFPWDYKAAELGGFYGGRNTLYVDFFAKMGWAYNLKTVSQEMIEKQARKTGDGSRNKKMSVDFAEISTRNT